MRLALAISVRVNGSRDVDRQGQKRLRKRRFFPAHRGHYTLWLAQGTRQLTEAMLEVGLENLKKAVRNRTRNNHLCAAAEKLQSRKETAG